mgnify:CR=1 FL=1
MLCWLQLWRNTNDQCLRTADEQMADYLTIIKLAYPNTYRTITQSDYLRHSHNRLYVYNTARLVLA